MHVFRVMVYSLCFHSITLNCRSLERIAGLKFVFKKVEEMRSIFIFYFIESRSFLCIYIFTRNTL
jgi:hypothetical protein